jgi:serine protease Do
MPSFRLSLPARHACKALASVCLLATQLAMAGPAPAAPARPEPAIRTVGTPDFAQIVQRYGPAVVNISASGTRQVSAGGKEGGASDKALPDDGSDPAQLFLRKFQEQFGATGASMQIPVHAMGSGFIVSGDGIVLTNAHVIAHATEVTVKLTDRREYAARILGSDPKTDVAVLKIDATTCPPSPSASRRSECGRMGAGHRLALRLDNTVTTSVVSAKGAPCRTTSPCPSSDRCRHQPRQLRRAAVQRTRRGGGHQLAIYAAAATRG